MSMVSVAGDLRKIIDVVDWECDIEVVADSIRYIIPNIGDKKLAEKAERDGIPAYDVREKIIDNVFSGITEHVENVRDARIVGGKDSTIIVEVW